MLLPARLLLAGKGLVHQQIALGDQIGDAVEIAEGDPGIDRPFAGQGQHHIHQDRGEVPAADPSLTAAGLLHRGIHRSNSIFFYDIFPHDPVVTAFLYPS